MLGQRLTGGVDLDKVWLAVKDVVDSGAGIQHIPVHGPIVEAVEGDAEVVGGLEHVRVAMVDCRQQNVAGDAASLGCRRGQRAGPDGKDIVEARLQPVPVPVFTRRAAAVHAVHHRDSTAGHG